MPDEPKTVKGFYTPLYGREENLIVEKNGTIVNLRIESGSERLSITVSLENLLNSLK